MVSGGGAGGSSAADSLCSSLGRESSSHQTEAVGVPKSVEVPGADGGVDLYAAALRSIRSGDSTEAETSPDLDRMRSTDLLSGESGSSDDVDFEFDRSVEELRRSRSPIEDVILGARSPEPPDSWQQQQQARGRQQQQQQTRGRQQQPEQPEQPLPVMASISAQNIIDQLAAVVSTPGNVSKRTPRDSPIRNRYTPAPKTPDHRPEEGWAADHEDGDNVGGGGGNATPEADRDVKTFFSSLLRTPGNPKTREGKPPHPISTIGARKQTTTDQQSDTVVKKSRTEKNASMAKSADIVNTGAVEAKKSEAVTRGGGKASVIETRREEGKKQQQVETESVVRRLHVTCTSLPESSLREETLADRSPLSETYSEGDGGAIGDKGDKPATAFSLPSVPEDLAAGEGGSAPPQALGMGKDINHAEAEGQSPATTPSPSSSGSGISDAEEVLRLNLGLRSSHAAESTSGAITKGGGALLEGLSSSYSPSEHAPKYSEGELQAKINAAVSSAKRGWADRLDETAQQAEEVERLREDAERLRGERKREEEMVIAERALREEEEKIRRVEEKKERAESEMVQMELDKKAEEEAKNQLSKEAEMLSSEEIQRLREEHKADLMILLRQKDQNLEAERKQWEELTAQKMSVQREEHQRILAEAVSAVEGGKDDLLAEGWDERQEELLGQVASLERQLADIQALHERELLSVQDQQRAEIDELINQLDAVEAEHNARYKKLRSEVGQKDAVISAVGTQLAEVNDKNMALQKASMAMTTDLEGARAEAEATRIAATELEESLELMRVDHKKAKDDEARRRAAACEEIKADMIRQAEEQFAVANAHYLKLKGEFENAKNANGKLEKELQKARDESRQVEKRRQAEEVEMRADVAQLRAGESWIEYEKYLLWSIMEESNFFVQFAIFLAHNL